MLRVMGYGQPDLWFDKAMVHQTKSPLTQVGLSLFGHFMDRSDQFLVLFQPAYTLLAFGRCTSWPFG